MKKTWDRSHRTNRRRGFTLVELIVAGSIAVIVIGTVTLSLLQLTRARSSTRIRLTATQRAATALNEIRRDIAGVLRSQDLFDSRVLITDSRIDSPLGEFPRDEMLIFSNKLKPLRSIEYNGEGFEYETQFRIMDDELGVALWQRRDAVPDDVPDGGGIVTPIADGIVGLDIQAYDGETWFQDWDSDIYGMPWAIRITIDAVGQPNETEPYDVDATVITLRTQIAIDRILPPIENQVEEDEMDPDDPMNDGTGSGISGSGSAASGQPGSTGGGGGGGIPGSGGGRGGGSQGGKPGGSGSKPGGTGSSGPSISGGRGGRTGSTIPSSRPSGSSTIPSSNQFRD